MFKRLQILLNNKFLKSASRDTWYYTLAQVGSKLITIFALPFLARTLNATDFSYYDIFLILSNFIVITITLGTDSGLVVGLIDHQKRNDSEKMLSIAIVIILIVWLATVTSSMLLFPFFEKFLSFFYLITALAYALLVAMQTLFSAFLRWTDRAKAAAIITFVSNVFGVLIGLLMGFYHKLQFLQYFIGGLLLGSFISLLISMFFIKKHLKNFDYKMDLPFIKEFFLYSIPFVPGSLVNNVLSNMDRIIIYPLFSTPVYATYAFCNRIMQIPRMGLSIIGTGVQPSLLRDFNSLQGKKRIKKMYEYFIILYIIIVIGTLLLNDRIILLFGGSNFEGANKILPVMVATGLFASSIYFNGWGYLIKKRTFELGIILFIFAIVSFPINYLMAKFFGMLEMLIVSMILNACLSLFYTYRSELLFNFEYNFQMIAMGFILIISLIITHILLF